MRRRALYNFITDLMYSLSGWFTFDEIKRVAEATGYLYYTFDGDFKAYGYIKTEYLPESFKNCDGSTSFQYNILQNRELSEIFQKKGIRSTKWGKLLNTFIENCDQATIDNFMTLLNAHNNDESSNTFRILDDVQGAYDNSSISSCMTVEDLVQIYKKIGVKYLQQLDPSGCEISRSLIWPNVRKLSSEDDDKFEMIQLCDRIYSRSLVAYTSHVKHVIGLGYHVRYRQNCEDYRKIWTPDQAFQNDLRGETLLEFKLSDSGIDLDDLKGIPWPYLDTFKFWNEKDQTFRNYSHDVFKSYECRNTNGESPYWEPEEEYECADCGAECDREDMVNIDGDLYCSDCYNPCDVCGENFRNVDLHEVRVRGMDHICDSCLERSDRYVSIPSAGYVIDRDNAVFCDDIEQWVQDTDDYAYCVSDERCYRNYDHLVLFEYDYYLPDCPKLKELQEKALECEVSA